MENKSHKLAYYSSLQTVALYSFNEIESTFPLPSLKLCHRLLKATWQGFHLFDKEM